MLYTYLMECFIAYTAFVCLFAAVRQLVILVVAFLMESFAAIFAHERFVPGMDASVGVQCGAAIECLAAGVAFVRLIGRVDDLVTAQCRRLSESLAADFAHKWPGAGVHGHVSCQIVVGIEYFATLGAGKGFLFAAGATVAAAATAVQAAD